MSEKRKPNPRGESFAERAAAARGDEEFEAPEVAEAPAASNSTFAQRAAASKQVDSDDSENKAVSSSESKSRKKS